MAIPVSENLRIHPPSPLLLLAEGGRALGELGACYGALPLLRRGPRGDGHPVMVLPGLGASDWSTRPLRAFLRERGYAAHGWGQRRNLGPEAGLMDALAGRLRALHSRHEAPVSLIGWSLGGIYARELAKHLPAEVRLVITLGSPFTGDPQASNARRAYELLSGRPAATRDVQHALSRPPPVPTTAVFSRSDGVVAWQCCVEPPGPRAESVEVYGSHCGLGHNPAVLHVIADRLAQPAGHWTPFRPPGLLRGLYPRPAAAGAA